MRRDYAEYYNGEAGHYRRQPTGKSPSPLSPSPTLTLFPPQRGFAYGTTPSVAPPAGGSALSSARSPTLAKPTRQQSPTMDVHWGASGVPRVDAAPGMGGNRGSPLTGSPYMPPPPMMPTQSWGYRNIFDDDANAEGGTTGTSPTNAHPRTGNPDSAVSGSISPLVGARYGYVANNYRPVSAFAPRNPPLYGGGSAAAAAAATRTSSAAAAAAAAAATPREYAGTRQPQRAASTVVCTQAPRKKVHRTVRCGVRIDDVDHRTGAVVAQYRCGARLGSGGFAEVFEFTDVTTAEIFACKVIDKEKLGQHGEAKVRQEVEMHKRMDHPNIIRLHKMFMDEYYYYILLELCSNKNLMEIVAERGPLPVPEVQHIMRQLTCAVQYMHRQRMIHRDIKLGNIMIDYSGNVKLGDFGFASEMPRDGGKKWRLCGTPNYIAPEILEYNETKICYGFEVDIWSLGVTLYMLSFGVPPFEAKDVPATYRRIRKVDYTFPDADNYRGITKPTHSNAYCVPDSCKELIHRMLQHNPARRASLQQVLESSFLTTGRSLGGGSAATRGSATPSADHREQPQQNTKRPTTFLPLAYSPPSGSTEPHSPLAMSPVMAQSPCSPYSPCRPPATENSTRCLNYGESPAVGKDATTEARKALHEYLHAQESSSTAGTATVSERADGDLEAVAGKGARGDRRALQATRHKESHKPVPPCKLPVEPATYFRRVVFAEKYGHAFTLESPFGKDVVALMFNDRTKLVLDSADDSVDYYVRLRCQDTPPTPQTANGGVDATSQNPGSLNGADIAGAAAARVYTDRLYPIRNATRCLCDTFDGDSQEEEARSVAGPHLMQARKKMNITKFLLPYLTGRTSDETFETTMSVLRQVSKHAHHRHLFTGPTTPRRLFRRIGSHDEGPEVLHLPYVKEAVTKRLPGGTTDSDDAAVLWTAARFSDHSYQVSITCTLHSSTRLVPATEPPVVSSHAQWKFDVLLYGPSHAVFGIETEHSGLYMSFFDVNKEVRGADRGLTFTSSGCTSARHTEVTLPTALLLLLCQALQAIRCPKDTMRCFTGQSPQVKEP